MNINLELYKIFFTVAKYKNITKAARKMHISQPAVSKAIKNLEDQLGGKLFVRTPQGVNLTSEGQEFYNYIEQAMEYIDSAEHQFSNLINLETGIIRIGVSTTLTKEFLLGHLKEFHQLYPNVDIKIDTSIASRLIPKLKNGLLDIVVLNLPTPDTKDIEITKLSEVNDILVVGEKYKDLAGLDLQLKDIQKYPIILQETGSNTRTFFDEFCLKQNIELNPHIILASYTLVIEFTKIGLGIGYATKEYVKDDLGKTLFELNITPKIPPRYVGIALSKKYTPSFSTKKLIEIIKKANL